MTEESARKVANLLIGAAAVGAAYYVITTPSLRRMALRLGAAALTTTLPRWLGTEVRRTWIDTGRAAL